MQDRGWFRQAMEYGYSIPETIHRNPRGERLMSREEWERLPRRRRWFDLVFGGRPPERPPPPWERDAG